MAQRKGKNTRTFEEVKLPNIQYIEKCVLKYIVGQDEPVRQIITAIYKSLMFRQLKSNLLIVGHSGTGKTETLIQILKRLRLPYTIEDATKYTQEGFRGADVERMILHLYQNAGKDLPKAQNGVIVIDEIDKKAGKRSFGERDISGVEVLNSLLKIIEGTKVKINVNEDFDTSNVMIVLVGAFSGLDKIREERLNVHQVGFLTPDVSKEAKDTRILKQDLIKYGLPEEFVGRIGTIVEMNKLGEKELASILRESNLSIFRRYQKELKQRGIILCYDGKLFERIAKKSLSLDTGARELTNTVNYIFEGIMYEVLSNPDKYQKCEHTSYRKCTLFLDIVDDNTRYEIS